MEMIKKLWNDEEGQGMVEYGLIIALVALVAIVGLNVLGPMISKLFKDVSGELETATP